MNDLRKRSARRKWLVAWAIGLAASYTLTTNAFAQNTSFEACAGLVFSTEEEFLSQGTKPVDGNPIISDGDLIARNLTTGVTRVCARNRDLVHHFDVREDMGLDAVDVIFAEKGIIAFSTELDSPHGNFTDGDILFPNGVVIPNAVLMHRFKLRDNMGLDGVHFTGEQDAIIRVVEAARSMGRDLLMKEPGKLLNVMKELGVDIWFSVEGTGLSANAPGILDGDILSAVSGSKVVPQNLLLDPPIPAGIPSRGVDFGVDAISSSRKGSRKHLLFSTEILYRRRSSSFTDGDLLRLGGVVAIKHETLVKPLEPAADFLGLDAVSLREKVLANVPHLDTLCGDVHDAADFDHLGLWRAAYATSPPGTPPRRPCGSYVPVDGTITPDMDVKRFRIAYRPAGTPIPAVGTAPGIHTKWKLRSPDPVTTLCSSSAANIVPLETDGSPQEWMKAKDYLDGKIGTLGGISHGCANSGLRLAVWDTLGLAAAEKNAHFIVWLEWETNGGVLVRDPFNYHVQLDNAAPVLPAYPDALQVKLADGSGKLVPACGKAPTGASKFEVWGQFADPYYWYFKLVAEGGKPPIAVTFPRSGIDVTHDYYEIPDGPPGLKNTDDTGTMPDSTVVHLRDIDMSAFGTSFKRCCYLLRLWVYDASILHSFNGFSANPTESHKASARTTFEAGK
jgi:hypothetical protein